MTKRQMIATKIISSEEYCIKAYYFVTCNSLHIRDRVINAYGLAIEQSQDKGNGDICFTDEKTHYFLFSRDEAARLAHRLENLEVTPLGLFPSLSELIEDF